MSKPKKSEPTLSEVYQLAEKFKKIAPWKYMKDDDVFAVQDPDTGENVYCCVMGNAGQIFALGIYDGEEGIQSYLNLRERAMKGIPVDAMKAGMEQQLYKVAFTSKEFIEDTDKKLYKQLGLKFRGENNWIQITRWTPGYFPKTVMPEDKEMIGLIALCLKQVVIVFEQFKKDPGYIGVFGKKLLLRKLEEEEGKKLWKSHYVEYPALTEGAKAHKANPKMLQKLTKDLPSQKAAVCYLLQYMPTPIPKSDVETNPFFPQISLWVAYGSAEILGFQLYSPKDYKTKFAEQFYGQLYSLGVIPTQILVNAMTVFEAISPLVEGLDVEVIFAPQAEDFHIIEAEFIEPMLNGGMNL